MERSRLGRGKIGRRYVAGAEEEGDMTERKAEHQRIYVDPVVGFRG